MIAFDIIVLHYSATYPDQLVNKHVIDGWHRARGFKEIGYHFVVLRNGQVEEGRPLDKTGAHVANQNQGKIGICWTGGLERATGPLVGVNNMTKEQEKATVKLIMSLLSRFPSITSVLGHNNLAATQCPGFDVVMWWRGIQKPDPSYGVVSPNTIPAYFRYGIVNAVSGLRLRDAATNSSDVILVMPQGTHVTISRASGDWYQVSLNTGENGWAHRDFIDKFEPVEAERESAVPLLEQALTILKKEK